MTNMHKIRNKNQEGFTLIELLLVLSIVGFLIYQAVGDFTSTASQADIEGEARSVKSLAPLVKNTFGTAQGNYTGLNNNVMLDSASFPKTMRAGAGEIRHVWRNNGIALAPATVNSADDSFTMTYTGVPSADCQDFVSKVYNFFLFTEVAGSVVNNIGEINTQCKVADPATIVFTAR